MVWFGILVCFGWFVCLKILFVLVLFVCLFGGFWGGWEVFVCWWFVCLFFKRKVTAMQFSKVLLKGRSRHTIQTLLCKSNGFPMLTPRLQQFTIQREKEMPPVQIFFSLYMKRTTDVSFCPHAPR